ncbi:MAG: hypothetical protein HOF01_05380 [Chloroflexi bacterium]|nr:hypothetical protein [Chloroflexota bacterium]
MDYKRRYLFLMMLGLVALAITGCSGGGDDEPSDPTASPGSTAAPAATATGVLF